VSKAGVDEPKATLHSDLQPVLRVGDGIQYFACPDSPTWNISPVNPSCSNGPREKGARNTSA